MLGPPAELLGITCPNFERELAHIQDISCHLLSLTL